MRWTGKLAVIGTLALLAVPTAWSVQQDPVVAGHTTYADMDGLDPCMAGIVGIVRLRVMWFNDQVLFERAAGEGSWVYAVETGAPDPRDAPLVPTGNRYPLTDPNGIDWEVREYQYRAGPVSDVNAGEYHAEPTSGRPVEVKESPSYQTNTDGAAYHAWIVETGPTAQDFAATGRSYNFVNMVDTCKFNAARDAAVQHTNSGGNWSSSWGNDTTEQAHLADDTTHAHDRFRVDLYVGKAPKIMAVEEQDPAYLGVAS